jgi:hypothetical protein
MPLRCPVCKAENSTPPACRRCKADLSMLFSLEDDRAALLTRARQLVGAGSTAEAARLASRANVLREDEESLQLMAQAWRVYQRLARRVGR